MKSIASPPDTRPGIPVHANCPGRSGRFFARFPSSQWHAFCSKTAPAWICALSVSAASADTLQPRTRSAATPTQISRITPKAVRNPGSPLLIETSAPVTNLLTKAQEGLARRDWKLTIDSLQRVIDDPEGTLFSRDEKPVGVAAWYESSRRRATRLLISLPPEGQAAYRVLYDGRAKGLLDRAAKGMDETALRTAVERYLLTEFGDDAADLLASWALDDGRPGEAVSILNDLLEFTSQRSVPDSLIYGKLAAAFVLLDRPAEAESAIARVRESAAREGRPSAWLAAWSSGAAALRGAESSTFSGVSTGDAMAAVPWAMPAVTPELHPRFLRSYALPGGTLEQWRAALNDDPSKGIELPPTPLVHDGRRMFARKPGGCVALDPEDLSAIWETGSKSAGRQRESTRRIAARRALQNPGQIDLQFVDEFTQTALSASRGLVFTVERFGSGWFSVEDEIEEQRGLLGLPRLRFSRAIAEDSTRLIAFDARSGEIRWQRGRTGDADDFLGDVRFASTPLPVGSHFWIPFYRQSDLYVGVLRPSDGALVKNILLGSIGPSSSSFAHPVPMSVSGGTVFVATGRGFLFAVDAANGTLRWASQYRADTGSGGAPRRAGMEGWIGSPPAASGGLVVLAPADDVRLMAFSAIDGELLWDTEPRNADYVVAVSGNRIFLGGRMIACRDLSDGKTIWDARLDGVPTGRAVLSGDHLLVPTSDGLVTLDASSGAVTDVRPAPASHPPLGNLLCTATAMYSVEPSSVRQFPDVEKNYAAAAEEVSVRPSDILARIRLARAELLRGRESDALALLDGMASETEAAEKKIAAAWSEAYVEALLFAAKGAAVAELSLRQLMRAVDAAKSPADVLRTRLAASEKLASMGRVLEAYRLLLDAGRSVDSSHLIPTEDAVETSATYFLAEQLRELQGRMKGRESATLEKDSDEQLQKAVDLWKAGAGAGTERDALLRQVELQSSMESAQRALLEFSAGESVDGQFERAEQLLLDVQRLSGSPAIESLALARQCELFDADKLASAESLSTCLDQLVKEFGTQPWPSELAPPPGSATGGKARATLADWVGLMRGRLLSLEANAPPKNDSSPSGHSAREALRLTGQTAWVIPTQEQWGVSRLVREVLDEGNRFAEQFHVQLADSSVVCVSTRDRDVRWKAPLRMPEAFGVELLRLAEPGDGVGRWKATYGETMVVGSPDGLFAVGKTTGRRLWVRAYETGLTSSQTADRDGAKCASNGFLAAIPQEGRIAVFRQRDGAVIWQRDLKGEPVGRIWVFEDRVVTADPSLQRVHLFDLKDGRLIKQVFFPQSDPENAPIRLVRSGQFLVGMDSTPAGETITGVDLATGERVWALGVRNVRQIFEPRPGHVGVGFLDGGLLILQASNGETVLEKEFEATSTILGAALFDGTLILHRLALRGTKKSPELAGFDVATGDLLWRRRDVALSPMLEEGIRVSFGVIPSAVEFQRPEGGPRAQIGFALIDPKTGENAGPVMDLFAATTGGRITDDVIFGQDLVVVVTNQDIRAFQTEIAPPAAGGKF